MTNPSLKSLSKPPGLLWVSCLSGLVAGLLAVSACGKKEEPEAPPEAEAPAEPSEPENAGEAGDAAQAEKPGGEVGEAPADGAVASLEGPTRKRPGDRVVRRPGRGEPGEPGADGEGREGRPRLRPGERPSPVMPAMPGDEAGGGAPDPLDPANPGGPVVPANPANPATPPTPTNPANPGADPQVANPANGGVPAGPGDPTVPAGNPSLADGRPNPTGAPIEVPGPTPEAERVLPVASVAEVLGGAKLSPAGPLPGIAVQPGYSSTHYAVARGKTLGVSLQIWQDPARRESDDRYRRMRLQYPKAEDVTALPPAKAFYSYFAGVQTLTFVDSVKRVVASVSCGEGVCNHDQLLTLARRVRDRL